MNEESSQLAKIKKTSKIVETGSKILKIFCMAVAALLAVTTVVFLFLRNNLNPMLKEAEAAGSLQTESMTSMNQGLVQSILKFDDPVLTICSYLLTGIVILVCLAVILHFVGRVFKKMYQSNSPFERQIIKDLRVTFVLITMMSLKNSLGIGLVVGLALWCVLQVFEYGYELQKLSDETL